MMLNTLTVDPVKNLSGLTLQATVREQKLYLIVGAGMLAMLVISIGELTPEGRVKALIYTAIVVVLLILLARFIVYSYKRERVRLNPYHRDHIIK